MTHEKSLEAADDASTASSAAADEVSRMVLHSFLEIL